MTVLETAKAVKEILEAVVEAAAAAENAAAAFLVHLHFLQGCYCGKHDGIRLQFLFNVHTFWCKRPK